MADGLARDHGVTIANSDPDGPPIGALAWRRILYITSQQPTAGSIVSRHDSVRVEFVDRCARCPEQEQFIDLTELTG